MSEFDPTDIRRNERVEARAAANAQNVAKSEADDLKWLMSSKRGRRIVWRQLERAGVFRLSFNTNSMTMAFNEGTKNEGLYTLTQIHTHCPELYTTMVKERSNDNRNHDERHNDH